MEKHIEKLTDDLRKAKDAYEIKINEANKIKELFYRIQGKLELANELKEEKSGGKK